MTLQIPGKTFLVGEYAVLVGGNALGIATEPYFETTGSLYSPHPMSAAGLFLTQSTENQTVQVSNPYSSGGFGFSTAEFIASWFERNKSKEHNLSDLFKTYKSVYDLNDQTKKIKPSGADLVIQMLGNITYFDQIISNSKSIQWPFPNTGFLIVSTGLKIKTHEHLNDLDLTLLKDLPQAAQDVIEAFNKGDEVIFFEALDQWSFKLEELSLQHNSSLEIKRKLESNPNIILTKLNGAMGADTITVFYSIQNEQAVRAEIKRMSLEIMADFRRLAHGVRYVD